MKDFIISIGVMMFTNIYIIVPYLDRLKAFWLEEGRLTEQVSTTYNILCAVSYLSVGILTYAIIKLVKYLIKKLDSKNL